jgi:MarR family transcriptional regulator, transcriptional regulator for hemolysin
MPTPTTILDDVTHLSRKMHTVFDNMVRERGQSLARARVLRRLHAAGAGENQKALAEHLAIEGSTVVRLLDSLEQLGCIERQPAADGDRRSKQIVLTEEGRKQAAEVEDAARRFRTALFANIDPAEMKVARKVIAQLHSNLLELAK